MINQEDDLINHRLTWLCQIQGFLFAALGVTWNLPDSKGIHYVFCVVGSFVALSSFFGLHASNKAIEGLKAKGRELDEEHKSSEDLDLPFIGLDDFRFWPLLPWVFLPTIFILAWAFIFVII